MEDAYADPGDDYWEDNSWTNLLKDEAADDILSADEKEELSDAEIEFGNF